MGVLGLRKYIESCRCEQPWALFRRTLDRHNRGGGQDRPAAAAAAPEPPQEDFGDFLSFSSTSNLVTSTPQADPDAAQVEHILIDFNSVIHSCYSTAHTQPKETIAAILAFLKKLFTEIVTPMTSLVICFDGPAPLAKLRTQRLRRRKQGHMEAGGSNLLFSDLSFSPGSKFLIELEQHVAKELTLWHQKEHILGGRAGRHGGSAAAKGGTIRAITIIGSSVPGEGEAKIADALQRIATVRQRHSVRDRVLIVGNDIDLVLTCVAAVSFERLYILNHQSMTVIDVELMMSRWWVGYNGMGGSEALELAESGGATVHRGDDDDDDNEGGHSTTKPRNDAAFASWERRRQARYDFVLLFSLNGGDCFVGLGASAGGALWARYRTLWQSSARKLRHAAGGVAAYADDEGRNGDGEDDGDNDDGVTPYLALYNTKKRAINLADARAVFECTYDSALASEIGSAGQDRNDKAGADGKGGKGRGGGGQDEDDRPRKGKNLSPADKKAMINSRAAGFEMLNATLWSFEMIAAGVCPHAAYVADEARLAQVRVADVRVALSTIKGNILKPPRSWILTLNAVADNPNALFGDYQPPARTEDDVQAQFDAEGHGSGGSFNGSGHGGGGAAKRPYWEVVGFLPPLACFIALMPTIPLLPTAVQKLLKNATQYGEMAEVLQSTSSSPQDVASASKALMKDALRLSAVPNGPVQLTDIEKFLTQYGDPTNVWGHLYDLRGGPITTVGTSSNHRANQIAAAAAAKQKRSRSGDASDGQRGKRGRHN